MSPSISEKVGRIYTDERDRILATLIGMLRDFDLAEETMQEAFATALLQWSESGIPSNPRAWIVSAARHKAIDRLRRHAAFRAKSSDLQRIAEQAEEAENPLVFETEETFAGFPDFPDDRLRLIFTCCHPALATEAQVALTLRTLCGLTTEDIARAFLVPVQTMAQRLVRVKRKVTEAAIPYSVPPADMLAARLNAVLVTVYLIFTAGYTASSGEALIRTDLCSEAIRLGRLLVSLVPDQGEAAALLALMLFHDSRRTTRADAAGDIVLLEDQDRNQWNRESIEQGAEMLRRAMANGAGGTRYGIEAQIAAIHATAPQSQDTDWARIVELYGELKRVAPSPVVELNEAVAIAMWQGPKAGLERLAELERSGRIAGYHLLPAAQASLLEKLGDKPAAAAHYQRALVLARNDPERRFLNARLAKVSSPSASC